MLSSKEKELDTQGGKHKGTTTKRKSDPLVFAQSSREIQSSMSKLRLTLKSKKIPVKPNHVT